jgi:CDGSH-type Zn-finger protein/truncated hemoglobin YjbI
VSPDSGKTAPGGSGKLAQVIASRGGMAAPEAPFVIEHREALIYMLCEAAELEHGIMCQYLFAAFSLKQRRNEELSAKELEAVLRWRHVISHVATEEMLHLALVHNLLSAVGAAPHLGRPNLPAPAHHYPAGVNLTLVPFGEPALRHFMFLERPEGMELEGAQGIDSPLHDAVPLMSERDIVPQPQDFATVGHLYRSIEHGLAHLAEKFGEENLLVGPSRSQATSDFFHWPELVPVTDLASAQLAIDTILEQGEGARGHWQQAHFGQFVRILDEFRAMKAANPKFEPARPVIFATVRACEHDKAVPMIGERVTSRIGDLFNVSYEILLQMLERFFAHTEETDGQLQTLAGATRGLMLGAIKPIGDLLTTLPVGPEYPELNAGPSFELFYENDYLMPHRGAAWALLEERVREASHFCGLIREIAEPAVGEQLAPVAAALDGVADLLASHFADWGGRSRFAAPPTATVGSTEPVNVDSLLAHGARLSRAVSRAASQKPAQKVLAELFDESARAFSAAAHARPSPIGDLPSPPFIAQRLLESVLRPLAEAITGRRVKERAETPRSGTTHKSKEVEGDRLDLDAVWRLARRATELRAGWNGDAHAGALLTEATAALQHLSLTLTPASEQDKRLQKLRSLQRACSQEIRTAHNGPYLVTNAERMLNWLGEELSIQPQMALCRCGVSALKPHCDGACARAGFEDKKDAKRVPDKRDTYDGIPLTVYDNRGICQHSGFCTDRLNSVFHTEGVFVTPSGGRMDEVTRAVRDCPSGALSFAIDNVEARAQVDWHGTRSPTIEVSKDGPYRFTGSIPLVDEAGEPIKPAAGSSLEHYALCRCGHSLNKPFCSGMHWYIEFRDPLPDENRTPSIFEWAGGLPALTRVARRFYETHIPSDPQLASLFADAAPDQPQRLANWLAEVFGGPPVYTSKYSGNVRPLDQGTSKALSEDQRARWVTLLCRSATEAGLPSDPEFQAAFRSYLEWESRRAVKVSAELRETAAERPVPHWEWTSAGPPAARNSTTATQSDTQQAPALPAKGEPIGFETNIKPLFRERDRQSMQFAFDLWSCDDVAEHADEILARLSAGTMPCDGAWPKEQVEAFKRWVDSGKPH